MNTVIGGSESATAMLSYAGWGSMRGRWAIVSVGIGEWNAKAALGSAPVGLHPSGLTAERQVAPNLIRVRMMLSERGFGADLLYFTKTRTHGACFS